MPELIFTASADADVNEIFSSLEDQRTGLGVAWFQKLDHRLGQLLLFPEMGPRWRGQFRRLLLRRTYGLIYQVLPARLVVVAVYSLRQSPESIWKRLRKLM